MYGLASQRRTLGGIDTADLNAGSISIIQKMHDEAAKRVLAQRDELLAALVEINERIKDHPAYAELTMEQEIEEGGDTAEFSYLSRLAKAAIAKVEGGA